MDVILLQEVINLGNPGEVVKVKNGYARNYLIPNKMAVLKTKGSIKILEKQKEEFEKQIAEKNEQYKALIEKLQAVEEVLVEARAGGDEKLFGTVTNQTLAEVLGRDHQIQLDKKQITLRDHIKLLGEYTAIVQLGKEFKSELKFKVVKAAD